MTEYVKCNSCSASISIELNKCEYCGNYFKNNEEISQLLRFKKEVEADIANFKLESLFLKINQSKFREHSIILYRKAKALLITYLNNDGILDAPEFCEIVTIVNMISNESEDYWKDFLLYTYVLIPNRKTRLYLNDFKKIKLFMDSIPEEFRVLIEERLIQQLIATELGYSFLKELIFYTNEKNFINNDDFLKKKIYIKNRYDSFINKINL